MSDFRLFCVFALVGLALGFAVVNPKHDPEPIAQLIAFMLTAGCFAVVIRALNAWGARVTA